MSGNSNDFCNLEMLAGELARASLRALAAAARAFADELPGDERTQVDGLERLIAQAGDQVRAGTLRVRDGLKETAPVIRLYKASAGKGRVKLQLFPLQAGEAHPPHAHHDLISCQIVLSGRVRMREYSLIARHAGGLLEVGEEPIRTLSPGDGVVTLERRNNIHWQQGLEAGTMLLNINFQGYLPAPAMAEAASEHGRCHVDWARARPAAAPGRWLVPESAYPAAAKAHS